MEKSEEEKVTLTPVVVDGVSNDNGILRDVKTGRLLPGTKSMNPKGKTRQKGIRNELKRRFGDDGKALAAKLAEIIMYDYDQDKKIHTELRRPRYEAHNQLKAIEMAMQYMFGRPSESVHVDQDVDITVETKMHRIAKLINDNKDKLRVIKGGAQDVITDA